MQVGSENRVKLIAAIVLMVLAAVFLGNLVFGGADAAAPAPTQTPVAGTAASPVSRKIVSKKRTDPASHSLDPTLRYDWLKASEDTKYEGNGRNIFLAVAEIPQPIKSAVTDQEKAKLNAPPVPPPPPPINLKFFGFANKPGEPRKIFLSQGDDVFIAREGDIVDRRYRILHIMPASVEIEDVLNNNRQNIPLTG